MSHITRKNRMVAENAADLADSKTAIAAWRAIPKWKRTVDCRHQAFFDQIFSFVDRHNTEKMLR